MFLRRKRISERSDEELVTDLRKGHQPSLGVLWDRYAHLLFGVGMKYMKNTDRSKDVVMDVFAALPELVKRHEITYFRGWIHTVMRNRCLMALRGTGKEIGFEHTLEDTEAEHREAAALKETELTRLEEAIERLNPDQQTCIRLFHLQRNSYQHVAERTGMSVEQVRSHIQNGRRNLRLMLTQDADQNTH